MQDIPLRDSRKVCLEVAVDTEALVTVEASVEEEDTEHEDTLLQHRDITVLRLMARAQDPITERADTTEHLLRKKKNWKSCARKQKPLKSNWKR